MFCLCIKAILCDFLFNFILTSHCNPVSSDTLTYQKFLVTEMDLSMLRKKVFWSEFWDNSLDDITIL